MSIVDTFERVGDFDRRLALSAKGLLGRFNAAGVLTAADVHIARTLAGITVQLAHLVLAGVSTDCCVLSTALAAADAGCTVEVFRADTGSGAGVFGEGKDFAGSAVADDDLA